MHERQHIDALETRPAGCRLPDAEYLAAALLRNNVHAAGADPQAPIVCRRRAAGELAQA